MFFRWRISYGTLIIDNTYLRNFGLHSFGPDKQTSFLTANETTFCLSFSALHISLKYWEKTLCSLFIVNVDIATTHEYFSDKFSLFQEVGRYRTRDESKESIVCRQQSTQARDLPCLWSPGQTLPPEVQNNGISGATKRTYVLQKLLKYRILKTSERKEIFCKTYFFQFQKVLSMCKNISMPIALCALGI